jgi:hypothetical protein
MPQCKWCPKETDYTTLGKYDGFCSLKCNREYYADLPKRKEEKRIKDEEERKKEGDFGKGCLWIIVIIILFILFAPKG